jgi:hypothetical protein
VPTSPVPRTTVSRTTVAFRASLARPTLLAMLPAGLTRPATLQAAMARPATATLGITARCPLVPALPAELGPRRWPRPAPQRTRSGSRP